MSDPKSNATMAAIVMQSELYGFFCATPFAFVPMHPKPKNAELTCGYDRAEQNRLSACRAVIDSPKFTLNG
jgi:hypothetical protein